MRTAKNDDTSYAPDQRLGEGVRADIFLLRIDDHVDGEAREDKHTEVNYDADEEEALLDDLIPALSLVLLV